MKIEDIDKEMKEVRASTAAAQKAFQEEDYVTAAKVYSACAEKMRKIYCDDHPDTIKCFLFAGDSFFYLERFSEAADTYLQLESIADTHPQAPVDRSVLYFKTAKALEKAKRFDAAQTAYSKAVSFGEKTLTENHPLLFDVSTPAPDENPVVVYSLDGKTWSPIKVEKANVWHTETIHFKGTGGLMTFSLRAGSEMGTTQRFVDNVRLFQDATPQEFYY